MWVFILSCIIHVITDFSYSTQYLKNQYLFSQVIKTLLPFHLFIRHIRTTRFSDSVASTQNVRLICINTHLFNTMTEREPHPLRYRVPQPACFQKDCFWLKCCFTSTETTGLLATGVQDGHLDFTQLLSSFIYIAFGKTHMRSALSRWWWRRSFMSSDVGWHIRDKLWPVRKHYPMLLCVHGNHKAR